MGTLFEELKRRKVFRVAAVYAVVAWLLIQIADVVLPTFGAPGWVSQTIIFLFILGFPIAVILSWAYEVTPEGISSDPGVQAQAQVPAPQSQRLIYAIFVLVLLVAGFQFSDRFFSDDANSAVRSAGSGSVLTNPTVVRSSIILNQSLPPLPGVESRTVLSLAPDGSTLAYSVWQNGGRLLLRDLATQETQEFEVDWPYPIFSPNSQNLLVLSLLSLKYGIMPAVGGGLRPIPIESLGGRVTWWSDEEILYQLPDGSFGIFSLADETDKLVPDFGAQDESGRIHPINQGTAFFFEKSTILRQQNQLEIQIYDLDSQSTALVTNNGYYPQYVNSGHVLFIRRGDLWAVPFDLDALKVKGPEARILEGVSSEALTSGAAYSVSDSGRLVYLPGPEFFPNQTVLVWTDRSGRQEEIPLPAGRYAEPLISPDGELLALTSFQADGSTNIWVYDFSRETFAPRTFSGNALNLVWDADGSRLFYQETSVLGFSGDSRGALWVMNANGTGQAERILDAAVKISSFSAADEKLIYTSYGGDGLVGQLNTLTFSDDAWISAPLLHADYGTDGGAVSPDGRWIAYNSTESGTPQIYVRPYPNLNGGKWKISSEESGNVAPSWGLDSDKLFFLRGGVTLMHTELTIEGDSISPGIVEPFVTDLQVDATTIRGYSVSNDGARFLHFKATVDEPGPELSQSRTELVMVENFFEELRRLAPPDPQ